MSQLDGVKIAVEILLGVLGFCLVALFRRVSDDIKTLTTSVQGLAVSMATIVAIQGDHGRRLEKLETKIDGE